MSYGVKQEIRWHATGEQDSEEVVRSVDSGYADRDIYCHLLPSRDDDTEIEDAE